MLPPLHGLRDTYIGALLGQLKMTWKICEFLFVIVQQVSLHVLIGPRRDFFVVINSVGTTVVSGLS